jgi:UPF0716 protein FxsA
MFLRLVLLFTVVPLVELFLLIQLGGLIGVWATVAIVVLTGVLGAHLTRLQGLRTVRRLREELASGSLPAATLVDGMLILAAGAVLLTPGLLTDAAGFFLLVPAGRALVRRQVMAAFQRRQQVGVPGVIDAEWRREG